MSGVADPIFPRKWFGRGFTCRSYRCIAESAPGRVRWDLVFLGEYLGSRLSFLLVGASFTGQRRVRPACRWVQRSGGCS